MVLILQVVFRYFKIADLLPLVDQVGDKSLELITLPDFVQALQVAADQVATLHAWKDRVNAYFALPWYKRIFTKPPTD